MLLNIPSLDAKWVAPDTPAVAIAAALWVATALVTNDLGPESKIDSHVQHKNSDKDKASGITEL